MSATPDSDSDHARMMAPRGPIEYLRANADGMRSMSPSELSQYHRNLEAEPSALSRINLRHERSPMPSDDPPKTSKGVVAMIVGVGMLTIVLPTALLIRQYGSLDACATVFYVIAPIIGYGLAMLLTPRR